MNTRMNKVIQSFLGWVSIVFLLFFALPSNASWNLLMYEDFERDADTWRWVNAGRQWGVVPWGPPQTAPHWGIQDFIFRPHPVYPERYRQGAWCDASTYPGAGGRDPEFDRYRTNMHTVMYWGPFSTIGYRDARATFYWVNHTAPGDTFFWEAAWSTSTTPPDPINQRSRWFRAVWRETRTDSLGNVYDTLKRGWHTGQANQYWRFSTTSLDSVDSAGTIISLMNKQNVFIGFRFKSNAIMDSLIGTVVEDVRVALDDGLFDLEIVRIAVYDLPDTVGITYPQAQDTVLFFCEYKIRGNGILYDSLGNPVRAVIQCQVNNVNPPFYSDTVVVNAGEEETRYRVYTQPYILPIEGPYTVTWTLDATNVVNEGTNEGNNIRSFEFQVVAPNYPPTLQFVSPLTDTIVTRNRINQSTIIPLLVRAYDPDDTASYYLFNHADTIPGSGSLIQSNRVQPIMERDTVDTIYWNLQNYPDGIVYLSAVIQDLYNEPVFVLAPFSVSLVTLSAEEPNSTYLPSSTSIHSAYPNPFNAEVNLSVGLAKNGVAEIVFHDISGREVDRLKLPNKEAGWQNVTWRPNSLASGVYIAQLFLNGQAMHSTKLMYMK
ncbi:MAG: T9SS type A sorting domain-containing protein [bacterium]|nr:T9SS type A sorting domain-containing protein [bacterium]